MKNPFRKKKPFIKNIQVFDDVTIELLQAEAVDGMDQVDVVELFDANGKPMTFELLANAYYLGDKYMLLTVYYDNEPDVYEERTDVFIMKEVFVENQLMLEPVENPELVNRIFSAFRQISGDKYDFLDNN